jgi:hypothetical protein
MKEAAAIKFEILICSSIEALIEKTELGALKCIILTWYLILTGRVSAILCHVFLIMDITISEKTTAYIYIRVYGLTPKSLQCFNISLFGKHAPQS